MRIDSVTVERKFNLGNYQTRGVTITISPAVDDNEHSINDLIAYVDSRIEEYNKAAKAL